MVNVLKAAVIGCGRMGAEPLRHIDSLPNGWEPLSHAESLQSAEGIQLQALCDLNEENLIKWGNYYHIEKKNLFQDYQQLIDTCMPDIITIATRTPSKKDIIEYACKLGVKGIYVEKPLANNLADCVSIINTLKKNNVKCVYGVNRRYHAAYQMAKQILAEGSLGDIEDISVDHGKSLLMWTHPHSVDLILYFLNTQQLQTIQSSLELEDHNTAHSNIITQDLFLKHAFFEFSNGLTGKITTASGLNVRISASKGNLTIHGNGSHIEIYTKKENASPYYLERKHIDNFRETHGATVFALESLRNAILYHTPLPIQEEEILMGMKMIMGCVWSHLQSGKRISPDEIPESLTLHGMYHGMHA